METHPDFRQILPATTSTTTESLTSTDVFFPTRRNGRTRQVCFTVFPAWIWICFTIKCSSLRLGSRSNSVGKFFPSFSSSFVFKILKKRHFWWMDRVEDGVCYVVHFTVGFTPCHHQATTVKLIWASSFHPPAATATIQPIRISSSLDGLKWRQIIVTVLSVASLDDHCHLYHHNIISCRPSNWLIR